MTVFADIWAFDFTHAVLTLTVVPVVMGLVAAAVAMVRDPKGSSTLIPGCGRRGTGPRWENRHGLRHRRPSWMSDQHGRWTSRPQRPMKPNRSVIIPQ
jgi:hypothetical protein